MKIASIAVQTSKNIYIDKQADKIIAKDSKTSMNYIDKNSFNTKYQDISFLGTHQG